MNIENWLYPRPKVNWMLAQYTGEIIWVPVYAEKPNKEKAKVASFWSLFTPEEQTERGGYESSGYQPSDPSYQNNHFKESSTSMDNYSMNTESMSHNQDPTKIDEMAQKYKAALGIQSSRGYQFDSQLKSGYRPSGDTSEVPPYGSPYQSHLSGQFGPPQNFHPNQPRGGHPVMGSAYSLEMQQQNFEPMPAPRPSTQNVLHYKIPCMWVEPHEYCKQVLIYFHSNAEDIHLCRGLCEHFSLELNVAVLAVEYPGYGYYKNVETSEEVICSNAETVYDFVVNELKVAPRKQD